jgi:HEAT repeat protein
LKDILALETDEMYSIRIARFAVVIVLFVPRIILAQDAREPEYQNVPLSKWIGELSKVKYDEKKSSWSWSSKPERAYEAFRHIGPRAVPALIDALKDDSFVVRYNATESLMGMGPEARQAVPALVNAQKDKHLQVQLSSLQALEAIGPEASAAIPALAESLRDTLKHPSHSYGATWRLSDYAKDALVNIGAEAVPEFIKGLKDIDNIVRYLVVEALGEFPSEAKTTVPLLIYALSDKEPLVRAHAAESLGKFGAHAKSAAVPLATHLDDLGTYQIGAHGFPSVYFSAVDALAKIGPTKKQIPFLIEALQRKMIDSNPFNGGEKSKHIMFAGR